MSTLEQRYKALLAEKPGGGFFGGGKQPQDPFVVRLVHIILEQAVIDRASDIHIEPIESQYRVRYRVDGVLERALVFPKDENLPIVPHIKVLAGLDPEAGASTSKVQDGRAAAMVNGKEVDLRLSAFPTIYGEKVVLRIADRTASFMTMDRLGFLPATLEQIRRTIHRPQGMIIVTGPSGSGKSTTLYAILQALNSSNLNIVTLEDPIEVKLPGINQSSISVRTGFTFAEALRGTLRQDPNVIMVGEVRDLETVEIAIRASLTGHLVFTTLHTNSAVGSITRLMDMRVEPYMVASALTAVFAQRLIRKICPACKEKYNPPPEILAQLSDIVKQHPDIAARVSGLREMYHGKGCQNCRGTGYLGRVLVFEMVHLTTAMRKGIMAKGSMEDIQQAAFSEGMETLLMDGLQKVVTGITTLEEVIRVVELPD